jgi:PAS domain-containing protein
MGSLILRWLRPSPAGPIDRATYRLRLVLAVQIAVFGVVGFLVLSLARPFPLAMASPELLAHLGLGLALWTNRINWATVLTVASLGVAGMAIGGGATLEIMFIFYIIPLVLPFYASTRLALTTQILVWVMVAGAGTGLVVAAPDRVPWNGFIVQISAIGLVGTLMVIFRFSLVQLIGRNQRLENTLAQYRVLYDHGTRATLVLSRSGHIREVHGEAVRLLGLEMLDPVGLHYTDLPASAIGSHRTWEAHLKSKGAGERKAWVRPSRRSEPSVVIHLARGTAYQRGMGMALVAEVHTSK